MARKSNLFKQIKEILPVLTALSAVIITVISAWLTIKLVPITQSVVAVESRVSNVEVDIADIKKTGDNIQGRVDDIYELLVK